MNRFTNGRPKSPAGALTVIAASMHGFLRLTCNHNHKVLASACPEMKRSEFW